MQAASVVNDPADDAGANKNEEPSAALNEESKEKPDNRHYPLKYFKG